LPSESCKNYRWEDNKEGLCREKKSITMLAQLEAGEVGKGTN
jgi:hypothetical protein